MSWKNPDAEVRATGWPAVIIQVAVILAALGVVVRIVMRLFSL